MRRFVALAAAVASAAATSVEVRFTADVLGAVVAVDGDGTECYDVDPDGCACYGGSSRRAGALGASSSAGSVLRLDGGGHFYGSGLVTAASDVAPIFAAEGYDAWTLNFRDLSQGAATLASYVDAVGSNPVASNLVATGSLASRVATHAVTGGFVVLGLFDASQLGGAFEVLSYRRALAVGAADARANGASASDVVVLVVSGVSDDDVLDILGSDYDASDAYPGAAAVRKLAEEHTNIDVVFASDVDGLATLETLENWAGAPVVISSPGAGRTSLASVAFDLTSGAVVDGTAAATSTLLDCASPTDAAVATLVDAAAAAVAAGWTASTSGASAALDAGAAGALVADALRDLTGAAVAFADASRLDAIAAGTVSSGDLLAAAPSLDEVLVASMTGGQLVAALAAGAALSGGTPHEPSSNAAYEYHVDARAGYGADDLVVDGYEVDDEANVTVAFPANAGGFAAFEAAASKTGVSAYAAAVSYASGLSDLGPYAAEARATQTQDLAIVNVAVLCGGAGAAARETCDAARAAFDAINDDDDGFADDLLPHTFFNVTVRAWGGAAATWAALPADTVAAVVVAYSPALPDLSHFLGPLRGSSDPDVQPGAVLLSPWATSTSTSDRTAYPNVARLVSTEAYVAEAFGTIMDAYAWRRVAIVYEVASSWAINAAGALEGTILDRGGTVAAHACVGVGSCPDWRGGVGFVDESGGALTEAAADEVLASLAAVDARVIYVAATPASQRALFRRVKQTGERYGAGFAWLTGWPSEDALLDGAAPARSLFFERVPNRGLRVP